jgi:hypothetical protein
VWVISLFKRCSDGIQLSEKLKIDVKVLRHSLLDTFLNIRTFIEFLDAMWL